MIRKKSKRKPQSIFRLRKTARYWFQRYIRLTRNNCYCIYGCGTYLSDIKTYDACHYLKAELYPDAVFNDKNVHPGCKSCNIRSPLIEYRKELVRRHGRRWVEALENSHIPHKGTYHWDREFLMQTRDLYKKKCRDIEKNK